MKNLKLNIKLAQNIKVEKPEEPDKSSKQDFSEINNQIYLSSYHKANDYDFLKNIGITHIINCASGSKNFKSLYFEDIKYLLLDIKDEPGYDIIHPIFLTIDFIESAILAGGKVLIHCFEVIYKPNTRAYQEDQHY
jgi:hypothetical protein